MCRNTAFPADIFPAAGEAGEEAGRRKKVKKRNVQHPLTRTRLKNEFLNVVKNPFNMIVAVTLVILFCLIAIPLLQMVATTFTAAKAELSRIRRTDPNAQIGSFTLYYWKYLMVGKLSGATLWGPLKNSLVCGFFTVIIAVPLGAILAWLIVRSDLPGKKLIGIFFGTVSIAIILLGWLFNAAL